MEGITLNHYEGKKRLFSYVKEHNLLDFSELGNILLLFT